MYHGGACSAANGPSIKHVTLFFTKFDSPVTLCHTSRGPPKVRHTSRTPRFLVVQKPSVQSLSQWFAGFLFRVFVWKVLSEVGFVHSPSVRIPPLQQKFNHHFQFHVSYV